ncbi:MAG: DeoR/GlpR family DNA-binding transcription regulator [Egibacteraceae bacterium]
MSDTEADGARSLPARIRRDRMLALLREQEFLQVSDLAGRFEVSEVTVRTDLDALERRGQLRRVRGGAVPRAIAPAERRFEDAEVAAATQKRAIGQAAAELIEDGDTLILDVGTTTTAVAQALAERLDISDVTVFTSSLTIALALERAHPRITVIVTGGTLRPQQHSLVEPLAGLVLGSINARKAFLGCNGVDVDRGVTNVNLPETEIKRLLLGSSQERIVCADSSKLGQVALAHVCSLEEIDLLITDDEADPELLSALRNVGLAVRVVANG